MKHTTWIHLFAAWTLITGVLGLPYNVPAVWAGIKWTGVPLVGAAGAVSARSSKLAPPANLQRIQISPSALGQNPPASAAPQGNVLGFGYNLLANNNAETGTPGAAISGWGSFASANLPTIGSYNGANMPLLTDLGPAVRGSKLFAATEGACGTVNPPMAYQSFDLTPLASVIASGQVSVTVSGYFGGLGSTNGTTSLNIQAYDSIDNTVSMDQTIGNFSAADRAIRTGLLFDSYANYLSPHADSLTVILSFHDLYNPFGCLLTAYSDNLSLVLTGPRTYIPLVARSADAPSRTAPATPTGMTGSLFEYQGIKLSWNKPANITGYQLERQIAGESAYKTIAYPDANATSYFDTSEYTSTDILAFNAAYHYRLTAINAAGNSTPGTFTLDMPAPPSNAPTPPASCWLSNQSATTTVFSWTDSSANEEYFALWMSVAGTTIDHQYLARIEANNTSATLIDLSPGYQYTFGIEAWNHAVTTTPAGCTANYTPPSQGTVLQIENHSVYSIPFLLVDGLQQFPVYPMGIPPYSGTGPAPYYEMPIATGSHTIEARNGWWQDSFSRFDMYISKGSFNMIDGANSLSVTDPTLADVLSQFKTSAYWEGYYFDNNFACHTAAFVFNSTGSYTFFSGNVAQSSGGVSQTSINPATFSRNFTVNGGYNGLLMELQGSFLMQNGPAAWPKIEYTAKDRYMYNSLCP